MNRKVSTALAAAGVACALMVGGACADRADFHTQRLADVRSALRKGGIKICSESHDPDGLANQATETRTYNVAIDCKTDEPVRLIVDRFSNAADRDGAARQFEVLSRPRSDGVVWTWGPYTLFANGARDDNIMERLTTALDDAGAK